MENKNYNIVVEKLKRVQRILFTEKILKIIFQSILVFIISIIISTISETFFIFPKEGRFLLFASTILFVAVVAFLKLYKFVKEWKEKNLNSLYSIALLVGEKFPQIKDRLRNALQIYNSKSSFVSKELTIKAINDIQNATLKINFVDAVSLLSFKKLVKSTLLAVVVLIALLNFSSTGFSSALNRIINYDKEFALPLKYIFEVSPQNVEAVKGDTIKLFAKIKLNPENLNPSNKLPQKIKLVTFIQEDNKEVESLEKTEDQFITQVSNIRATTYYYFEVEKEKSSTFRIHITEKPLIRILNVEIIPPNYTLEEKIVLRDNVGDVAALKGSLVKIKIEPNKKLLQAKIVFSSGLIKKMNPVLNYYETSFILNANDNYTINLTSEEQIKNEHKIFYKLVAINDQFPVVEIASPEEETVAPKSMVIPIELRMFDDYGITSTKIGIKLIRSEYEKKWDKEKFLSLQIPFLKKGEEVTHYENMDLTNFSFSPNDVVEYYAEVTDNDVITGPKTGKSKTHIIRFPSLEEVFQEVTKQQTAIESSLEQSIKEAKSISKEMNELLGEIKQQKDKNWKKEQAVESLKKNLKELESRIENINKEINNATDKLQKNQLLSTETIQKYSELQQLLKSLNLEDYQRALQKLQENMKGVSQDELNKLMKNIEFNDEAFRASIERTLNLLKRIKVEQKVDELTKRAEELLQNQIKLEEETSSQNTSDEQLESKQNKISEELNNLKKEMEKLQSQMEEFPTEMPMQTLDETKDVLNENEILENLNESLKNLKSGEKSKASSSQKKSINDFQKLSSQFMKLKDELLNSQSNQVLMALQKAIENLLELSQRQEKIKSETKQLENNSSQFREKAQEELSLQSNILSLMQSLSEASQKTFKITSTMGKTLGEALREAMNAVQNLEQRNSNTAIKNQESVMTQLNKSANQLQKAISELQQQGGSGGMSLLQQFRQLMGEQQLINLQTEGLASKQGYTKEQLESIGKLAAQQELVRKSLEELSSEASQNTTTEKLLSNTKSILEEMREVVKDISEQNINESTVEKQHKIISRMLDFQRSTQERDYEEKRKATAATDKRYENALPEILQKQKRRKIDLIELKDSKFTKEYKELIRSYYELFQKEEKN